MLLAPWPSAAVWVDQSEAEFGVVALLVDTSQATSDADRAELNQLALAMPPTQRLMICLLQSAFCTPPVAARGPTDRDRVQKLMASALGRVDKAEGLPRTEDISRVLNTKINPAFEDFWNSNIMVRKGENDRQILIVLTSPTIYLDLGSRAGPDRNLHNSRVPGACFPDPLRTARMHAEARLKLVVAVAGDVYPDTGIDALARVVTNSGERRLDGIYQVMRKCPKDTDNTRNWLKPVAADGSTSCEVQPVARRDRQLMTCRSATTRSPESLVAIMEKAPYADPAGKPAVSAAPNPPATTPAPRSAPPKDNSGAATALPSPAAPAPAPAPAPVAGPAAPPAAVPPTVSAPAPDKSSKPPEQRVAVAPPISGPAPPVSTPAPPPGPPAWMPAPIARAPAAPVAPPRPPRPGPDPATVTAAADASPPPLVTGTLVGRQLVLNANAGPVTIAFVRAGEGFDLKLALADGANVGVGAVNQLVLTPPLRAGSYRIVATPILRDPHCTGTPRIRGAVNINGPGVSSSQIALDLELSRCAADIGPVAIGRLLVR
jgi:hypothetical protein